MNNEERNLKIVLGIFFLVCVIVVLLTMKIAGSSNLPIEVEKKGYCKKAYGDEFSYAYVKGENTCKSHNQTEVFSEDEFLKVCPDQKFFSKGFNSECFNIGRK